MTTTLKATGYTTQFVSMIEQNLEQYGQQDSTQVVVDDVRKILGEMRRQYDEVHRSCQALEEKFHTLKESIRQADNSHSMRLSELDRVEEQKQLLANDLKDALEKIEEARMNGKVYRHMLERIKKEQDTLRQTIIRMETRLSRRKAEVRDKIRSLQKQIQAKARAVDNLEQLEGEIHTERDMRETSIFTMRDILQGKKDSIRRRQEFEKWRREVALDAATEAFNASAGKLRKMLAFEKITGSTLQQIIYEQVERSQATEDAFQKIREVTGLTDVMDIVSKFLNRNVELEQLHMSVKEAEARLEARKDEYRRTKEETDGLSLATEGTKTRRLYAEVEECDAELKKTLKNHSLARDKLQVSTLQLDATKRWAQNLNRFLVLGGFETEVNFESPDPNTLVRYLQNLHKGMSKFAAEAIQHRSSGKKIRSLESRSKLTESTLLEDAAFMKRNVRVKADRQMGSAQGPAGGSGSGGGKGAAGGAAGGELDEESGFTEDRGQRKMQSAMKISEATRKGKDKKGARTHR